MQNHTRIFIRDLRLMMSIGVSEPERAVPQPVVVNILADVVPPAAWQADDFAQVVCYATIAAAIRQMAKDEVKLVETFAERIAVYILDITGVIGVNIRVEKTSILPDAGVGVDIYRTR